MPISVDEQLAALHRRCERILSVDDLRSKLQRSAASGKQLRIKLGMDPTAPDVTLGHAVPLKVIRQFQEWGHRAVLIIGDYTARVGDPSGVNTTRPMLSAEEIDANAKTYVDQLGKILLTDDQHLEVRFNGQWLGKLNLLDIIRLASRKTVSQMLERDSFKDRFQAGTEIRLHEFMYPLMQAWDSVVIDADVEMGGSDQLFNNLVGRELMGDEKKEPQVVIVTPLLVGTDGIIKMSKSKKNYIAVTDPPSGPQGMFGKVMSLPDALMESYYTLLTELPAEQFNPQIQSKPRDAKVNLARELVRQFHGDAAADAAKQEFDRVIVGHAAPAEAPTLFVAGINGRPLTIPAMLMAAGFTTSRSEGVRKIKEGAVKLNGTKVDTTQPPPDISKGPLLQLGNRRFVRLEALEDALSANAVSVRVQALRDSLLGRVRVLDSPRVGRELARVTVQLTVAAMLANSGKTERRYRLWLFDTNEEGVDWTELQRVPVWPKWDLFAQKAPGLELFRAPDDVIRIRCEELALMEL